MSEARFAGKVAIVTGGSRGIGRAIVLRLAAEGASMALAGRDEAAVQAVVAEVGAERALGLALDLREPEDIAAMVAFVASAEGRLLQGALIDMDGGLTKTI